MLNGFFFVSLVPRSAFSVHCLSFKCGTASAVHSCEIAIPRVRRRTLGYLNCTAAAVKSGTTTHPNLGFGRGGLAERLPEAGSSEEIVAIERMSDGHILCEQFTAISLSTLHPSPGRQVADTPNASATGFE